MEKKCQICGNNIGSSITIDGKTHALRRQKFCVDCQPFDPLKTQPVREFDTAEPIEDDERKCFICGRVYKIGPSGRGKNSGKCQSCTVNHRRFALMKQAREYLGGECKECGYNQCPQALVFHHRNPDEKSFTISSNFCRSWEVIKAELDKCDLLCMNCHTEHHYEKDRSIGYYFEGQYEVPTIEKRCLFCDKQFYTHNQEKKYCSSQCRKGYRTEFNESPATRYHRTREEMTKECLNCNQLFIENKKGQKYCSQECSHLHNRKTKRPSREQLEQDIASLNWCEIGRKYGVTDNAVRKWARFYGLL